MATKTEKQFWKNQKPLNLGTWDYLRDRRTLGRSRTRQLEGREAAKRRASGRKKTEEEIKQQLTRIAALAQLRVKYDDPNGLEKDQQAAMAHANRAFKLAGASASIS